MYISVKGPCGGGEGGREEGDELPNYKLSRICNCWSCFLKAGFHRRRSRSRSRNQKGRPIRSSENQTDGVGSRTLILLMSPLVTIKWKLHCRSRKQKRKNKPMTMFDSRLCDWLVRFRLRQPSFHWIISDGVVSGVGRNGNVLILPTPIPSSLWLCLRLRFSIFTRS